MAREAETPTSGGGLWGMNILFPPRESGACPVTVLHRLPGGKPRGDGGGEWARVEGDPWCCARVSIHILVHACGKVWVMDNPPLPDARPLLALPR